jgi:hypothetical protein
VDADFSAGTGPSESVPVADGDATLTDPSTAVSESEPESESVPVADGDATLADPSAAVSESEPDGLQPVRTVAVATPRSTARRTRTCPLPMPRSLNPECLPDPRPRSAGSASARLGVMAEGKTLPCVERDVQPASAAEYRGEPRWPRRRRFSRSSGAGIECGGKGVPVDIHENLRFDVG